MSTSAPHFVAKIHKFPTRRTNERLCREQEQERIEWLQQRVKAHSLAIEARSAGYESVKKYLQEVKHENFDEEFDEDRLVVKVPGMNIYLEMYGCLDKMPRTELSLLDASKCLQQMAQFFRVNLPPKFRASEFGSDKYDPQPNDDWREDYDVKEYFPYSKHLGIGFSQVDMSRRPDRMAILKRAKEKNGDKFE